MPRRLVPALALLVGVAACGGRTGLLVDGADDDASADAAPDAMVCSMSAYATVEACALAGCEACRCDPDGTVFVCRPPGSGDPTFCEDACPDGSRPP